MYAVYIYRNIYSDYLRGILNEWQKLFCHATELRNGTIF